MGKTTIIAEAGTLEIVAMRVLDAPPNLVYKAYTDPDLLRQWLGPRDLTMIVKQMDVKPGGSWRYVHRDQQGNEYGFHGVYHDVTPSRIVQTFEFEGMPGHVSLDTATLEDVGGKTKLTMQSVFQSVADRDGMLASGMESGVDEGLDKLDEVLKELQTKRVPVS
jgi:uncharacterized protein YndB with AHSA1/START domain